MLAVYFTRRDRFSLRSRLPTGWSRSPIEAESARDPLPVLFVFLFLPLFLDFFYAYEISSECPRTSLTLSRPRATPSGWEYFDGARTGCHIHMQIAIEWQRSQIFDHRCNKGSWFRSGTKTSRLSRFREWMPVCCKKDRTRVSKLASSKNSQRSRVRLITRISMKHTMEPAYRENIVNVIEIKSLEISYLNF